MSIQPCSRLVQFTLLMTVLNFFMFLAQVRKTQAPVTASEIRVVDGRDQTRVLLGRCESLDHPPGAQVDYGIVLYDSTGKERASLCVEDTGGTQSLSFYRNQTPSMCLRVTSQDAGLSISEDATGQLCSLGINRARGAFSILGSYLTEEGIYMEAGRQAAPSIYALKADAGSSGQAKPLWKIPGILK